ncbi:MAG: lipopolysaccharide biosynthesis protein [Planctomycetota bacterium JB042]
MTGEGGSTAEAERVEVEAGEADEPARTDLARRRGRDLSWTLFGKLAATGANSLLVLALAVKDLMDAATYGLFVATIGAQLALSRLILLGVDQGTIRLYTLDDLKRRPELVLSAGLASSLVLSIPVLLVGFLAAPFEPRGWSTTVVLSVALGAVGVALFDYGVASRLARLRYRRAAIVQASMPVVRFAGTLSAVLFFPSRPEIAFGVYAGTALLFGAALSARTAHRTAEWPDGALIRRLLRYSKWLGAADVSMILCINAGLFLLRGLDLDVEAGVFGFAQQVALGYFAVFLAFYQTILPRAARLGSVREVPAFVGRWTKIGIGLALACAVSAPVLAWILDLFMESRDLEPFHAPFYLMAGFVLVLIVEAPLSVACQYLLLPQLPVLNLALRLVLVTGLGYGLVPRYGAVGAGVAQVVGSVASMLVLASLLLVVVKRRLKEA